MVLTNDPQDELLDVMAGLCHAIAFETGSKTTSPGTYLKNKEETIAQLFAMTGEAKDTGKISSLAESFGLMLVKLEARELSQENLIEELTQKNQELKIAKERLGEQNKSLVVSLRQRYSPARFVGQCPEMRRIMATALNLSRHPINTLILGASGTGKEVMAKIIHFNSPRADKPFLPVNCTAIPDSLFESEMFGIEKGVATGVVQRKGVFEQAHTGTLFLDEIGEMSLANQAKLLRVLEERKVVRVGGRAPIDVDFRLISATNVDLERAVQQGDFRQDLFYRLNVVSLTLPPLKDRGEDILVLAEKLLSKNAADLGRPPLNLAPGARKCIMGYDWPGNVRELNNEMERAAALTLSNRVEAGDLSSKLNDPETRIKPGCDSETGHNLDHSSNSGSNSARGKEQGCQDTKELPPEEERAEFNLSIMEQETVFKALASTLGNKTRAASLLGITREGLRKKLLKLKKNNPTGKKITTNKNI
ncbi:MAG: sigma-54 dependent transcriptional regulator [Desulfobacterium sp.]|nr:sigma-54 dependent transcriptional regulator [Desulfobacterium sp.]